MKKQSHFIKKSKRTAIMILFGRSGFILFFFLLQLAFFVLAFLYFSEKSTYFWITSIFFSLVVFSSVVNSDIDPTAKLTWATVILLFPIFGGAFFVFTQSDLGHRHLKKQYSEAIRNTKDFLKTTPALKEELSRTAPEILAIENYLKKSGCHPIYGNTSVTYHPSGESFWKQVLEEVQKAERFIFLEYFIIEEGVMWNSVLKLLEEKAKNGVDVRLLYDGTCDFTHLRRSYPRKLKKTGIKVQVFSPIRPFISTRYNYRDHRKILAIDGKVGFLGGINMADEYINRTNPFGHWKDSAIMLKGEAVNSLTLFFLEMWNLQSGTTESDMFSVPTEPPVTDGIVIPYRDCPVDEYKVGRAIYLDILNRAQKYVHIMSPYLILDSETEYALRFAAERGVEVILIIPSIPDKKLPYALATTHFSALIRSGVRIFEYTPGFVHAKVFISDNIKAVCGSINLDYRSLYHHFESAAYLYGCRCIQDMEADFQSTLSRSTEITPERNQQYKRGYKLMGNLFKIIAPLL